MAWLKREGDYWWLMEKVKDQGAGKWKNKERSTGLKDKYAAEKYCADYNEDLARVKRGLSPINKEAARSSNWWPIFKAKVLGHADTSMSAYSHQKVKFLLGVMEDLFSPQDLSLEEFKKKSIGAEYIKKRLAGEPKTKWCGTDRMVNRPAMPSTIKTEISFLSPLFEKAINEWEDIGITKNPFRRLKVALPDGVKENKEDPKYLPFDILAAFFAECKRRHGPAFEFMAQFFYYMAPRLDEARHVRVEDVDLKAGTIRIRGTKTAAARRTVEIPATFLPRVEEVVRAARPGFLFATAEGGIFPYSTIQQRFKRAFRAVGAPWAHAHTLRHCYTSHRLEAGDNLLAVRDSVGHKNISTTNIYGHRGASKQQISLQAAPQAA